MTTLTLEQAARASGRSARELRLLLEDGRLRGALQAGRWRVEPSEVDGLASPTGLAPAEQALRAMPRPVDGAPGPEVAAELPASTAPIGAGPTAPIGAAPTAPSGAGSPGSGPAVEELVSRLEQRAIEVARLRGELEALREGRDEHGARVERELRGLRRELADAREELASAHGRIAELELGEAAQGERRRPQRPGMSEALSPLFRAT